MAQTFTDMILNFFFKVNGDDIPKTSEDVDGLGEKTKKTTTSITDLNQAVQLLSSQLNSAKNYISGFVTAFAESENSVNLLKSAIEITGNSSTELYPKFEKLSKLMQKNFGISDETILDLQRYGLQLGALPGELEQMTQYAIGVSKSFGIDLTLAMRQVISAGEGNYMMLQRYLPSLRNATSETEKAAIVQKFFADAWNIANENAGNTKSVLDRTTETIGDVKEIIGETLAQAINPLLTAFADLIDSTPKWVIQTTGLITVIGSLTAILIPAVAAIKSLSVAFKALGVQMSSTLGVIGLVSAALSSLIFLLIDYKQKELDAFDLEVETNNQRTKALDEIAKKYGLNAAELRKIVVYERYISEEKNKQKELESQLETIKNYAGGQYRDELILAKEKEISKYKERQLMWTTKLNEQQEILKNAIGSTDWDAILKAGEKVPDIGNNQFTVTDEDEVRAQLYLQWLNEKLMEQYNLKKAWQQFEIDEDWKNKEEEEEKRIEEEKIKRMKEKLLEQENMLRQSWGSISKGFADMYEQLLKGEKGWWKAMLTGMKDAIASAIRMLEAKALATAFSKGFAGIPEALWVTLRYESLIGALQAIKFAQGGVVDQPTLALLGEAGQREFVTPEITFEKKFDQLASKLFSKNSGSTGQTIIVEFKPQTALASDEESAKNLINMIREFSENQEGLVLS